jgi:AcrR family transcriptional regulator
MIETTELISSPRRTTPPGARRPPAIEAKQERSRANREALLDAFTELLGERPYADITVGDIARHAGLTTGAVYARFGDKRGVALAVHERFVKRSAKTMEAWGARPQWATATPEEIIHGWTRGAVNFGRLYGPLLTLMINDPAVREQYDELMALSSRILARLLCHAMPGESGGQLERDVDWAARAAQAVLERFDPEDEDLCPRVETLLRRLIASSAT